MSKKSDFERTEFVVPNEKFWAMLNSNQKSRATLSANAKQWVDHTNEIVIGLDPGETTGYALYNPVRKWVELRHLNTKELEPSARNLYSLLENARLHNWAQGYKLPQLRIVAEDYKIYGFKSDEHKWSGVYTLQWIGAIRAVADRCGIPIHFQMAAVAKGFCTDKMLEIWGVYNPGLKHARDAERHLLHYLLNGT